MYRWDEERSTKILNCSKTYIFILVNSFSIISNTNNKSRSVWALKFVLLNKKCLLAIQIYKTHEIWPNIHFVSNFQTSMLLLIEQFQNIYYFIARIEYNTRHAFFHPSVKSTNNQENIYVFIYLNDTHYEWIIFIFTYFSIDIIRTFSLYIQTYSHPSHPLFQKCSTVKLSSFTLCK